MGRSHRQPHVLLGLLFSFVFSVSTLALTAGLNVANLTDDGERPHRLRADEREDLREQHRAAEELGREVGRLREQFEDTDLEDASAEMLREMATRELEEAAHDDDEDDREDDHDREDEHETPTDVAAEKVCFRSDGSVTQERNECDPHQGRHFGTDRMEMREDAFNSTMETHFSEESDVSHGRGPHLLDIIGEALKHLSGAIEEFSEHDPPKAQEIREVITWLASILSEYAANQPSPEESRALAEQVWERLMKLKREIFAYGDDGDHDFDGDFDCTEIVGKVGTMIDALGWIIEQFENTGIPVPQQSRDAARRAQTRYEEIEQEVASDPEACDQLEEIFELLEREMRPPMMEAAMRWAMEPQDEEERLSRMEKLQELMMSIERRMSEIMGDMGPPDMGQPPHMEPPPVRPDGGPGGHMPPGLMGPAHRMGEPHGMSPEEMIEMKRQWIERMSNGEFEGGDMEMDMGNYEHESAPSGFEGMELPEGMSPEEMIKMKRQWIERMSNGELEGENMEMREYEHQSAPAGFEGMPMMMPVRPDGHPGGPEGMELPEGMSPEEFMRMKSEMREEMYE